MTEYPITIETFGEYADFLDRMSWFYELNEHGSFQANVGIEREILEKLLSENSAKRNAKMRRSITVLSVDADRGRIKVVYGEPLYESY
jgi:hypothetical protein